MIIKINPAPYAPSDLSPRRFEYMLAITSLDDVWDALEVELKSTDRALFAQIKAQRSALSFSQVKTLGLVTMFWKLLKGLHLMQTYLMTQLKLLG